MTAVWVILAGLVGLAAGGVVAWLLADRRCQADRAEAARAAAETAARFDALRAAHDERGGDLVAARKLVEEWRAAAGAAQREGERAKAQADAANAAVDERQSRLAAAEGRLSALQAKYAELEVRGERLATQLAAERESVAEQKRLLVEAEGKFKDVFAGVGSEALDKNSKAFLDLAKQRFETLTTEAAGDLGKRQEQIKTLVEPMTLLLQKYEERLKEVEKSRTDDKQQLTGLLAALQQSHQQLSSQTTQLVGALRRPTTRGQWGEITLRRLVEMAGMSNYCDFCEQQSVETEDGRLRPDMVVTLPNDRQIVVDSKVVFDSFADGINESDEQKRQELFKAHARAVRGRFHELAQKRYQDQFSRAPEFVIMFMPGEAVLYAAVEQDPALVEDAMAKQIVIATPTTLIALLKAIELGWRQQRVAENAEQIRKLGEELHQRIGVFVGHFARVGKALDTAADAYNAALSSMERNLLTTTQRIEDHGVRSSRAIEPPVAAEKRIAPLGDKSLSALSRAAESGYPALEDSPPPAEAPAEVAAPQALAG